MKIEWLVTGVTAVGSPLQEQMPMYVVLKTPNANWCRKTNAHAHVSTRTCIHIHDVCTHIDTCMYTRMYANGKQSADHSYLNTHMCMFVGVHMYAFTCAHMYIHT